MSRPSAPYDKLPLQTVRQRRGMALGGLRAWARQSGQKLVEIDLQNCTDKVSVLREIAQAFGFPSWFGLNLDALYDSLTDLPEQQPATGYVVMLENLPRAAAFGVEQRDALLDVFRDAAERYAEQGVPFRVLYS
jgi:RNAse (barnase) inhibitor barstar